MLRLLCLGQCSGHLHSGFSNQRELHEAIFEHFMVYERVLIADIPTKHVVSPVEIGTPIVG